MGCTVGPLGVAGPQKHSLSQPQRKKTHLKPVSEYVLCWPVFQIVCDAGPLVWAHIPMHIAILFLNGSLKTKYATSRQPEHTVTGYSIQSSASAYTLIPRTIHVLAFFRSSSKASEGFCAILRQNFIHSGPVVANCQIFDVGMSILVSRTDLSCSVNIMPCQRFARIVYQAPLLV